MQTEILPAVTLSEGMVYVLAIYRDGSLSVSSHISLKKAQEAFVDYLAEELTEDDLDEAARGFGDTIESLIAENMTSRLCVLGAKKLLREGGASEIVHTPVLA